jgi:competence protein ComEC
MKIMANNLIKRITSFWKSGLVAKIITVATLLVLLCCSCFSCILLVPGHSTATTALSPTPVSTSTLAILPSLAATPTAAFLPTASSTITFAQAVTPPLTATEILSAPSLSPTPSSLPQANPLRIHYVDVGQGDSILLQLPDGRTMLIDGGDTNTGIVAYLHSVGIQRIDLMIATHPHSDHIGGLVQVLQAFPVTKVVTNGQPTTTTVYEHFLDAISASKAAYIELKRGDTFSLSGIDFHCLNPASLTNPDLNENSIVLQFTYGATTFLMMGDSGANIETALLSANLLSKVDILKVGHHGSSSGSTPAFLSVIKPAVAIYSAGINNPYGHPAPQTIANLKAAGATVYGTDRNGTVIVSADQNGYTLSLTKGNATPASTPTGSGPTPTLTRTAPAAGGLAILSVSSSVSVGSSATLTAQTSPNASCSIIVHYKSGPSHASGLAPKNADASGTVSWTWKVGTNTTRGTWPIDVTCGGITKSSSFTVQ